MLVDINLLPKKEPKKIGFIVAATILVCCFIAAAAFFYWQGKQTKTEIEATKNQIAMAQKLAANIDKKNTIAKSSNSVNQLKKGIAWANDHRLQTIPLLRHLTALLPERGFIQSFSYQNSGKVTLAVQFDTKTEAADYLHRLNGSDWIQDASLDSLSVGTASNSVAANGNTSVNSNNSTSSGTTSGSTTANTNSKYLPRYLGQFTMTLNQAAIKKAAGKTKDLGKGVSGS